MPSSPRSRLQWVQRASEQQARGKDDGGTSALFQDKPGGSAHDQHLRQRPRGFGNHHDGFVAALDHPLLAPRILRSLTDQARGTVEHSHGPDHVKVSDGHAEPSLAPRQRGSRPRPRAFREQVSGKPETKHEKHTEGADHAQQGMHEEENANEEGRPERVKQGRTGPGLSELTQGRKVAIGLRRPRPIGFIGEIEARGECCRMEFFFKPLAHSAQCGAAQCIEHAADHDGKRNDERQHQQRIAAAARQHAIIDLKQIDGRREKKEIVAAAIRENQSERPRAGPQGRLQRRPRW